MNKSESKYFNTACLMDEALLCLLEKKDFEFITVKEICKKAGVNRSTFYLHYENTDDLLTETNNYLNNKFFDTYKQKGIDKIDIAKISKEESIFITPQYLVPYLEFLKEHKKIFKTIYNKPHTFEAQKTFERMYKDFFAPALAKFNIPKIEEQYIFEFFTRGVLAIIVKWINLDCVDSIEDIVTIILKCVNLEKRNIGMNRWD